jgi:hypothetical protein
MNIENPDGKRYLEELYVQTGGKTEIQVSMFDVGKGIGLEKSEAGLIAEELIIDGLAELKSLSGGVGITLQGVAMLQGTEGGPVFDESGLQLGNGRILEDMGRQAVENVLADIRGSIVCAQTTIGNLEEVIADIKTIETQMLSPQPKTAIIREVLRSLHQVLDELKAGPLAEHVNALILS